MRLANIDRLVLFALSPGGVVLTQEQLTAKYGFEPDGSNFYYGVNDQNLANLRATGRALNTWTHRPFFANMLASMHASGQDEKTVVLGLEPPDADPGSPDRYDYSYMTGNDGLLGALADELNRFQEDALSTSKRLNIFIRFPSEMNDTRRGNGVPDPTRYTAAFRHVRPIFAARAPRILFSFSPAIRADLNEADLTPYWPGDDVVDMIAGTWYIGGPGQAPAATAFMTQYFLHRVGKGKPFGISELGGCNSSPTDNSIGSDNDAVVQSMLHSLEGLQLRNVSFKYVTLFLQNKWGADATLGFLDRPA